MIRIGPAGWSYKDCEGTVYPQKPGKKFDPLEYLARYFNTIEINSSFYRPPTASTTTAWVNRVAENKEFAFTAKLNRLFTHERGKATAADEKEFHTGMTPLLQSEKLGALLLQFPWSLKNTVEDREYLAQLLEKVAGARRGHLQHRPAGVFEVDSPGGANDFAGRICAAARPELSELVSGEDV